MKANELMIGDWVRIKDLKDPIKRITPIDEPLGIVYYWDAERLIATSINNVLPIPLTAEIVEDRSCPQVSIYWDDRMTEETGENWYEVMIHTENCAAELHIRYVHELQHALRLCGVKKEIIL